MKTGTVCFMLLSEPVNRFRSKLQKPNKNYLVNKHLTNVYCSKLYAKNVQLGVNYCNNTSFKYCDLI